MEFLDLLKRHFVAVAIAKEMVIDIYKDPGIYEHGIELLVNGIRINPRRADSRIRRLKKCIRLTELRVDLDEAIDQDSPERVAAAFFGLAKFLVEEELGIEFNSKRGTTRYSLDELREIVRIGPDGLLKLIQGEEVAP